MSSPSHRARRARGAVAALALTAASALVPALAPSTSVLAPPPARAATPIAQDFRDDFDGPAGSAPDPAVWGYDTGRGFQGWGNWEKEFYTDSRHNSWLDGEGHLVIQAKYEQPGATMAYGDDAGNANNWETQWTSARLTTKDKLHMQYGRAEARIKVPQGAGIWPAFWALGADIDEHPWPDSGEIDIFEGASWAPNSNLSNVFGGPAWDDKRSIGNWTDQGAPLGDDFHTYAVEWTPDTLQFFFDGELHHEVTRAAMGSDWRFDKPQYLLLNVAVGGGFGGAFDENSAQDSTMVVDWVRVTEQQNPQQTQALAMSRKWTELGGLSGQLGDSPRSVARTDCTLRRGGCVQRFEGGLIYNSPTTGTHQVWGRIEDEYARLGWETSRLGYPISDEICGLRDGGCVQRFEGGLIYWQFGADAHPVWGAIQGSYAAMRWENSHLRYPVTQEFCGLRDGGCGQHFQQGSIYWSPASGAHPVIGEIRNGYARLGWERGALGYPTGPEYCGLRDGGCFQPFQGGLMYWSPRTGAHAVWGMIGRQYAAQRWETGPLGYPVGPERVTRTGWVQDFQGGRLTWRR